MTQLREAVKLLKKWKDKLGDCARCSNTEGGPHCKLCEDTDNFLEAYRVSLDG